jgi:hypothetical protein
MEIALPLVALSGLYFINNQKKNKKNQSMNAYENFTNRSNLLPNTDIPDKNYNVEAPFFPDLDRTNELSVLNKYDNPNAYTDKFFTKDAIGNAYATDSSDPKVNPTKVNPTYTSLTGETVNGSYFEHNNMVPFFGSTLRNNIIDSNATEGVLDNMNGSGSQYMTKKEQSPLFSPHTDLQWAHGAPNLNDFYQSRVNPSAKMTNVKPFAEERVGPGLGLGYTTEGSGGFNSGMGMRDQWVDRGVDELRVANKPKASGFMMLGHEGPANSMIKNNATMEQMGVMERHGHDNTYEFNSMENGHSRAFTTTGIQKGQTLHSIPMFHDQARTDTTVSYTGVAGSSNPSMYTTGEYMPSNNIHLGAVPIGVANANGRHYANNGDYEIQSKVSYPNNRSENDAGQYFGGIGGAIGSVVAPLLDALRPSRRENTIGSLRPYQNPGSTVAQSYIFNPADRVGTTIRETTENSKFHLNANANQNGGAYKVSNQQSFDTNRRTTDDFYYAGISSAGAGGRQVRTYDAEYNQRNNDIKSSTIQGHMVQGNMKLMNGNVNYTNKPKDNYLANNRDVVPTMPYQTPDINNFGKLQGTQQLYSGMQIDRNDASILDSLKGNPYAISITR